MKLHPFLSYYGSKWKRAARYPAPEHDTVIEPFAGAAGYSLNHSDRKVVLVERDPRLVGIWRFLIRAKPSDVLALPLMDLDQTVTDLPDCDPDGRELIRGWLQGASRNAKNSYSSMAKARLGQNPNSPSFWSAACRARIAKQVQHIKHWTIIEGDYSDAPDSEATWFVDPPYNNAAGRVYRFHDLDYPRLGAWCADRMGLTIVCENLGADWLPFSPLYHTAQAWNTEQAQTSVEAVWINRNTAVERVAV